MSGEQHAKTLTTLPHLFRNLEQVLEALCQTLDEEQRWAIHQPTEPNTALVERKLALLQSLEALDQQRQQRVTAAGQTNTPAGMDALLASLDDQDLTAQWKGLLQQLQRCQALNETNGTVIRQGINRSQQLLAALRGEANPDQTNYQSDGSRPSTGGRELGRA